MTSQTTPVILEVAVNGTTSRARNPNVPRSPSEVTEEALRCLERGASIIHNHTDDPIFDGVTAEHSAEPYIEAWRPVLEAHPDALLYPTMTGAGPHTTIERRYGHLPRIAEAGCLTMGIVDPGSLNLAGYDVDGGPMASDLVYVNSSADACHMVETCNALGVPISFSIFDGSFMRTAVAFIHGGRTGFGGQIKLYFGSEHLPMGLPATASALNVYLEILGDCAWPWSVSIPGGDILATEVARLALERGGHLRVGLEDYVGPDTPTNLELLERAVKLCEEVGRPVATPTEARALISNAA